MPRLVQVASVAALTIAVAVLAWAVFDPSPDFSRI